MSISSKGFRSSNRILFMISHTQNVENVNLLRFNCHKFSLYTSDKGTYLN